MDLVDAERLISFPKSLIQRICSHIKSTANRCFAGQSMHAKISHTQFCALVEFYGDVTLVYCHFCAVYTVCTTDQHSKVTCSSSNVVHKVRICAKTNVKMYTEACIQALLNRQAPARLFGTTKSMCTAPNNQLVQELEAVRDVSRNRLILGDQKPYYKVRIRTTRKNPYFVMPFGC